MEEFYGVKVDYDEARELADCASIYQDLTFAENILKRLIDLLKSNSNDRIIIECLWTTACISYARAFASGKRHGLNEDIFKSLQGDPIGVHNYIMNQRNKHIAHSVNPFEQVSIDLQLTNPISTKREIIGIATVSMKLSCVDIDGAENIFRLTGVLRSEVGNKCKELQVIALEAGKRLPIDELYKRERSKLIAPSHEDAGKARK